MLPIPVGVVPALVLDFYPHFYCLRQQCFSNKMKNLLYLFLLIGLIACGGDDDENDNKEEECNTSIATGTIDGKSFSFGGGKASLTGTGEISLKFYDESDMTGDVCGLSLGDNVSIFGSLPLTDVGRAELFFGATSQTLTMLDPEDFTNIIAVGGFVEFTVFTDERVEGFMDVNDGLGNSVDRVCGTFVLDRCD